MNLERAKKILGLSNDFSDVELKKKYKDLAMKYHPDKYHEPDANEKFSEINQAHDFIKNGNNEVHEPFNGFPFNPNFIFNMFKTSFNKVKSKITVTLSFIEYQEGAVKEVSFEGPCICDKNLCLHCAGSGFSFLGTTMGPCTNCIGEGFVECCNGCDRTKKVTINIGPKVNLDAVLLHPLVGEIRLELEKPFFYKSGVVYYRFDISLKESLTGFNKIFKDPFGVEHNVRVNTLVKSNDGYRINDTYILVFNVIYPKRLNKSVIKTLSELSF
jgi:DnaJ-class molecular chaperone